MADGLEDLLRGCFPGMPPLIIYNPLFAFETGDDFMRAWFDAAAGKLDPFILVLEGSVPNEEITGEGCWAAFGVAVSSDNGVLRFAAVDDNTNTVHIWTLA